MKKEKMRLSQYSISVCVSWKSAIFFREIIVIKKNTDDKDYMLCNSIAKIRKNRKGSSR